MKAAHAPQHAAATQGGRPVWLSLRTRNLIIDVAGRDRAASSVQADQGLQETCLEGRTLRKARVYGCKPERWPLQRSFEFTEECSC